MKPEKVTMIWFALVLTILGMFAFYSAFPTKNIYLFVSGILCLLGAITLGATAQIKN